MARSFFSKRAALILGPVVGSLAVGTGLVTMFRPGGLSQSKAAQDQLSGVRAAAPEEGDLAPDFEIRDVEGRPYRLRDHVGKGLIIIQFGSFT
jgi:hypothetical protein